MIRRLYILLIVAAAMMAASCERLPLYDEESDIYLELNIDLEVEIEGTQPAPTTMVAAFYHPDTHERITNQFTGPTGGQIFVDPGTYHLLCYNLNAGSTHVRLESTYHLIEAYTNSVREDERYTFEAMKHKIVEMGRGGRSYFDEPMIYEPDHLYVAHVEETVIPVRYEGDRKIVIHADASTMVQSWTVEIGDIVHPEWVRQATVYITGQVPSRILSTRDATGVPATLYFTVYDSRRRSEPDTAVYESAFRTFGRYPGDDNEVYLILDVESTGGSHTMWEWNVSDQMKGDNRHIIVRDKIEVPDPATGGGGFIPTVIPWNGHNYNIDL